MSISKRLCVTGWILTALAFLVLIASVSFLGIPFANRKAAQMVDLAVRDSVDFTVSYSDVKVDILRGKLAFHDLSVHIPDFAFAASELELGIPFDEIWSFGAGRSSGFSQVHIETSGAFLATEEGELSIKHGSVGVIGTLLPYDMQSSTISTLAVDARSIGFRDMISGAVFHMDSLDAKLEGFVQLRSVQRNPKELLDDVHSMELFSRTGTMIPDADLIAQLGMFALVSPWIANPDNWRFDELSVMMHVIRDAFSVERFSIVSPLMDSLGNGSIPRGESQSVVIHLEVGKLHQQVREELGMLVAFLGQSIPEGHFHFDLVWNGSGLPYISFH